ncbi:MAG: phosphoenolpyruvate mutase, partial [Nanoarchaeota archaeon]
TGLIVENAYVDNNGKREEFDASWISSLTDSAIKGRPDSGVVDFTSRLYTINQVLDVTTKPIIVDGDNGGLSEYFTSMVRTLERHGVSAVVIEDKTGQKRNSLQENSLEHVLDTPENFSAKILAGKKVQVTDDFMIIARIESLIVNSDLDDTLQRAQAYISAGADSILIHDKSKNPSQIFSFCKKYSKFPNKVPLVVVPTTYNSVKEEKLADVGVNMVIYANHLLRSAYPAMIKTAKSILTHGRSKEADKFCMPVKDILELIPRGK